MSERALIMTDEEFHLFRDFVYAQSHIYCASAQRMLFEKKIRRNVETLALPSFQAYYDLLTRSPERARECARLLESIAVHETSFFRISGHFTGLTEFVFPQLSARPEKTPIHLWSVGCSTGEEPYSIIMTFLEYQEREAAGGGRDLAVFASDLSASAIAKAEQAAYFLRQLRKIPQPFLDKYFICHHDQYHLVDKVKQRVTFRVFNLVELPTFSRRMFDVIFCRNVLIYFSHQAQIELLDGLLNLLRVGGYLFLGDAESLHVFPDICKRVDLIELRNAVIYQKRGRGS